MKANHVGFVLIAAIVLGAAAIVFRLVSVAESDETVLADLNTLTAETVDKVVLTDIDATATLTKVDGQWWVGAYPVVDNMLEQLWETADGFEGAELVASNPQNHMRMGVSAEVGTRVEFWQGDQRVEDFVVGDKVYMPVGDEVVQPWKRNVMRCYLRRPTSNDVYSFFCPTPERFPVYREVWGVPWVIETPATGVQSVSFTQAGERFDLKSVNGVWVVDTDAGTLQASHSKALLVLGSLRSVRADEFPPEEEVEGLDWSRPDAAITIGITSEEGVQSAKQVLFLEKDDGYYYTKETEKSWVYLLSPTSTAKVLKQPDYFLPTANP